MSGRPKELDGEMLADIYEHILSEFGRSSSQLVLDYISARGLVNYQGVPYSRQSVYRALRSTVRGRKLLAQTKQRIGR